MLIGAEDVSSAGHRMASAAQDMRQAAGTMDGAARDIRQTLDDFGRSFAAILEEHRQAEAEAREKFLVQLANLGRP